ncbi:MAG TPA: hypothetical protein PKA16_01820 [Ottowia sp.]|uniref:hypothetical protein n=1 Tax=Ottowia sp. TaxID=1898956 RepID=UPI002B515B17|nr:hypothetical protein [Ottowia sp.]HMN20108.1 hypothetical protein [Ottowia sp.]
MGLKDRDYYWDHYDKLVRSSERKQRRGRVLQWALLQRAPARLPTWAMVLAWMAVGGGLFWTFKALGY